MEIKQGTFTPQVFTSTGGMETECVKYHSRLTELIANKKGESYSSTIFWITAKVFRLLNIIKLYDLVTLHISIFMFKFHNRLLPSYFDFFFTQVKEIHKYNTRSAANQSY